MTLVPALLCSIPLLSSFVAAKREDPAPDDQTTILEFTVNNRKGDKDKFQITLHKAWAPHGYERVLELVNSGFLSDVRFFRTITGFMAQFGLSGDPALNKKWQNKAIEKADQVGPPDPMIGIGAIADSSTEGRRDHDMLTRQSSFLDVATHRWFFSMFYSQQHSKVRNSHVLHDAIHEQHLRKHSEQHDSL